ncbi:hypothetical protein V8E55_002675 [Tylopilus felleus]
MPLHSTTWDDNRKFSDRGIPESNETSPNILFRGQQMRCERTALSFTQPCPSSKKRPDIQSNVDWSEDVLTKFNIPFAPSLNTLLSTISDDYPMSNMTLHTSPHSTSPSQVEHDMSDSRLARFRIPPIPADKHDIPMRSKNQADEVFYDNDLSTFEIPPITESMKETRTVASSETSLSWDDDTSDINTKPYNAFVMQMAIDKEARLATIESLRDDMNEIHDTDWRAQDLLSHQGILVQDAQWFVFSDIVWLVAEKGEDPLHVLDEVRPLPAPLKSPAYQNMIEGAADELIGSSRHQRHLMKMQISLLTILNALEYIYHAPLVCYIPDRCKVSSIHAQLGKHITSGGRLARFVTRILKEMDTGFLPVESWCQQLSHNICP